MVLTLCYRVALEIPQLRALPQMLLGVRMTPGSSLQRELLQKAVEGGGGRTQLGERAGLASGDNLSQWLHVQAPRLPSDVDQLRVLNGGALCIFLGSPHHSKELKGRDAVVKQSRSFI